MEPLQRTVVGWYAVKRRASAPSGLPLGLVASAGTRQPTSWKPSAPGYGVRRDADIRGLGPGACAAHGPRLARRALRGGQLADGAMVCGHFGTFNDAVRQAGFQPRRAPARLTPNLTGPDAILEALVEWTRRYGDLPAMADWDPVRARRLGQTWRIARYHDGDWPSARSVAHHFGSFTAAVAAAGLVPRPRSSPPAQRLASRRDNRLAIALAGMSDRRGDAAALAETVRAVAATRGSGDPVALHAALLDVAAVALAYAELAGVD